MTRAKSFRRRLPTILAAAAFVGAAVKVALGGGLPWFALTLLFLALLLARTRHRLTDSAAFLVVFLLGVFVAHAAEPLAAPLVPWLRQAQAPAGEPRIGVVDTSPIYQQRPNVVHDQPMSSRPLVRPLEAIAGRPRPARPTVLALDVALIHYTPAETVPGYHAPLLDYLEGPPGGQSYEERTGIRLILGSQGTFPPSPALQAAYPKLARAWASVRLAPPDASAFQPRHYGKAPGFPTLGEAVARRYREATGGETAESGREAARLEAACPFAVPPGTPTPACVYVLPTSEAARERQRIALGSPPRPGDGPTVPTNEGVPDAAALTALAGGHRYVLIMGEAPVRADDIYSGNGSSGHVEDPPARGVYSQAALAEAHLGPSAELASPALSLFLEFAVALAWATFKVAEHHGFRPEHDLGRLRRLAIRFGQALILPTPLLLAVTFGDRRRWLSQSTVNARQRLVGRVILVTAPAFLALALALFEGIYWPGVGTVVVFLTLESFLTHLQDDHAPSHAPSHDHSASDTPPPSGDLPRDGAPDPGEPPTGGPPHGGSGSRSPERNGLPWPQG